eukprot:3061522-Pleurochrysis_carterae.AAC.1
MSDDRLYSNQRAHSSGATCAHGAGALASPEAQGELKRRAGVRRSPAEFHSFSSKMNYYGWTFGSPPPQTMPHSEVLAAIARSGNNDNMFITLGD